MNCVPYGWRLRLRFLTLGWLCLLGIAIIVAVAVTVPLQHSAAAPLRGSCTEVDWEVGGQTSDSWGVTGYNNTFNASAEGTYINALEVYVDTNNRTEIGWYEIDASSTRVFFVVWKESGQYNEESTGTASIANHTYDLFNTSADQGHWWWTIDGDSKLNKELSFYAGTPIAHRERWNSCDSVGGHWWDLNKCNSGGSCSLWSSVTEIDRDSEADPDWVQNYEFYARAS